MSISKAGLRLQRVWAGLSLIHPSGLDLCSVWSAQSFRSCDQFPDPVLNLLICSPTPFSHSPPLLIYHHKLWTLCTSSVVQLGLKASMGDFIMQLMFAAEGLSGSVRREEPSVEAAAETMSAGACFDLWNSPHQTDYREEHLTWWQTKENRVLRITQHQTCMCAVRCSVVSHQSRMRVNSAELNEKCRHQQLLL